MSDSLTRRNGTTIKTHDTNGKPVYMVRDGLAFHTNNGVTVAVNPATSAIVQVKPFGGSQWFTLEEHEDQFNNLVATYQRHTLVQLIRNGVVMLFRVADGAWTFVKACTETDLKGWTRKGKPDFWVSEGEPGFTWLMDDWRGVSAAPV